MPLVLQPNPHTLVFKRDDLTCLQVIGPDRFSWLQGMVSCNLEPLLHKQCVHGLILDRQGKIFTDTVIIQQQQRILLTVDHTIAEPLQQHLDKHLIMEDAEVVPVQDKHTLWLALGPASKQLAQTINQSSETHAAWGTFLDWSAALVLSTNPTAFSQSPNTLPQDTSLASLEQFHAHRIELGIPMLGQDFGPSNFPFEIGLDEHCVSFNKGCYVGQEVVARLKARGKSVRILKRLRFANEKPPRPKAIVTLASGKEIGTLTSVSQSAGQAIAFAILRRADAETADFVMVDGQKAEIDSPWGRFHPNKQEN